MYSGHLQTIATHTARLMNTHTHTVFWDKTVICSQTERCLNFLAGCNCLCGKNMFSLPFKAERKFLTLCSFVPLLLLPLLSTSSLSQSFYPGVIFPHPPHFYRMHPLSHSHTPTGLTHTQMEPVDLSVNKHSSSKSPPCSSASTPASPRSSPASPYSSASRTSSRNSPPHTQLRSSPSHALPPPTSSLPCPTIVSPGGPGVIPKSQIMVSQIVLPLPILPYYPPHLLNQPIMMNSPASSDDDRFRSWEPKIGESLFYVFVPAVQCLCCNCTWS